MRRPDPRWIVAPAPDEAAQVDIAGLAGRLGVPGLVARLLWQRGLHDPAEARSFLSPRLADLAAPSLLPDMDLAAERLANAVRRGERIAVHGDYDVDGMTSTALLVRFFRMIGGDAIWSIPDRDSEGYGMGKVAIERMATAGAQVVVTVDNGISAHEAVERAAGMGMDVIITDHHLPGETLPPAFAVVNPQRRDADGEGRHLCGCGLAFKLAWAIADRLRGHGEADPEAVRAFLRDAVGLVALATISDVVPLQGENRILVSAGLAALRGSEHPGIRSLLEVSRVGAMPLTTEDVAFRIAPRINAAGRLSRPDMVVELLTSDDAQAAHRLARMLHDANTERRRIEKGVLELAKERADEILAAGDRHSLVVHGEGWHRGVIGIVAARLVDQHHKPTVVIGFDGTEGRGSCRTPGQVNLHDALNLCGEHLSRFGGHAAAAGLEIDRTRIDHFADAFEQAVRSQTGENSPQPELRVDAESDVDDWTLDTVEAIRRLQPFGAANPEPTFLVRGAQVAGRARLMGQGDAHLTFSLKQSGGAVRVVAFRRADLFDLASSREPVDLVVVPMLNEWRGVRTAELRLVGMRASSADVTA